MFATLKNGQLVKKASIFHKKKKLCSQVLNVLWDEGYILGYRTVNNNSNMFEIFLKYNQNLPSITNIKSISKPGKRVYLSAKQLWKLDSSTGLIILSTNKGVLSIDNCKRVNVGGEPLVYIN
jgi:small subunit ribosomal protein S8